MNAKIPYTLAVCSFFLLFIGFGASGQQIIPSPKAHFGFNMGDDFHLATFTQTVAYFQLLAEKSDRIQMLSIGETEEGRQQPMLIVSSPENLAQLNKYQQISQQLAHAQISEAEARALSLEGKAVVWIDGGLHATETVGTHQLIELAWQLASRRDQETLTILDDVIILLVHANPDGQELVSNWYMRRKDPKERSLSGLPRLYQKYVGHDNNRDFFMFNMKESQNIGRQLFVEWIPQIMYNHHQSAPAGTLVAGAPYRDPYNYVFDPILVTSIDALGAAMHTRLNVEGKPGYTQRGGSVFSTWWNGGLRTAPYYHNMIGLLTEIVGNPTPMEIPLVPNRLLLSGDSPNPVFPQTWHFRQAIEYSISLNYAVLNYAMRYKDQLLFNIYRMGRNAIEKGQQDQWSLSPSKVEAIKAAYFSAQAKDQHTLPRTIPVGYLDSVMKKPVNRDPRGYIIPADQPDFPTAIKFLNALIRSGVVVQQATAPFSVHGVDYPEGSFIVKTDQAFRPQVLDMFEPQDHPNDFLYENGPPIPPYDAAGWTLAYLMQVKFDRILDDFSGPFVKRAYGALIAPPATPVKPAAVYCLSAKANDSYRIVNALLKQAIEVYRDKANGNFYMASTAQSENVLRNLGSETGVSIQSLDKMPAAVVKIKPMRVALWDKYGGSMSSGWLRWLLEQFDFNFTLIYAPDIDQGNLNDQYDAIVLVNDAIPAKLPLHTDQPAMDDIPVEYQDQVGKISRDQSIPPLKAFVEKGGHLVTMGHSANILQYLNIPVENALVEMINGEKQALPREKYYTPGSVLEVRVAKNEAATWGMDTYAKVYFNNSPIFTFTADAIDSGTLKPLLWFDSKTPLRSGWSWGQSYLYDGITAFEAQVGKGHVYVFGPEVTFRGQTHGSFKLLFNQLYQLNP